MKYLTMILFERIGLLLVFAFVLTRIKGFRSLLYREHSIKMSIIHICMFGLFGIASSIAGIVIDGEVVITHQLVWSIADDQMVVSLSLVAIVIAGLLGGPIVGLGAGMIAGVHLFFLGGIGWFANMLVNPITGLLTGLTARFFSKERVISPIQALFIGVFPPILQMQMLLILYPQEPGTINVVNTIGLPLVLSNSIAIAIFTAMIGIVLKEQENEAALATRQALTIAEEALPFLRKQDQQERAEGLANLLYDRLKIAAVSVTNGKRILAHKGLGDDHHCSQTEITTPLSKEALHTNEMKVAYLRSEIQCTHPNCPLEAAIIIPITEANDTAGLIQFYFRKAQHIRPVELVLAEGLGQLISNQLNIIANENLKAHIRDTELRNLQAQINPHFLFNTLHLIATLFRIDPKRARHITVQLANYMRFNLGLVSNALIHLEKECTHVNAYIEIVQARFASRLKINFYKEKNIPEVFIPPSTIQPLVENSIQHGLQNVVSGGEVEVKIKKVDHYIKIIVRDNGSGFPEDILDRVGNETLTDIKDGGNGLYNVNQRLISLLGQQAQLEITNLSPKGSEISFHIPYNVPVKRRVPL
ncbi:LytS/YhcK type 5TM receptor domain-containing protein [Virgibacillus sp. W0430]|uniref:LytS/YhcK type 5TM receptor domain-containing protein n=1 Tax=Virgibacillus sp. W0430 TaxID=3391580 RepID=UPI003F4702F7